MVENNNRNNAPNTGGNKGKKGRRKSSRRTGDARRRGGKKPFDGMRNEGHSTGGKFNAANPAGNRKSKRHSRQKVPKSGRAYKARPGQLPKDERGRDTKAVPWIEMPKESQSHFYYFIIREMLEGDSDRPELGATQLDLYGEWSVESILTQTPRLRRDWRAVVSVLRLLAEDNLVNASFVEHVLNEHPMTGARSVRVSVDEKVKHDYVVDKARASNAKWLQEAKEAYERAVESQKSRYIEDFVIQGKEDYPELNESEHIKAAEQKWKKVRKNSPPSVALKTDSGNVVCSNREEFVRAHMVRRAWKDAERLPTLYKMRGPVRVPVLSKGEVVDKSDFVNIEFAMKASGGLFIGVVHKKGGGKDSSPFRKHYAKMKSHRNEPSFIDGINKPHKLVSEEIVRPVDPSLTEVELDGEMSLTEMVRRMSSIKGFHFKDDRFEKRASSTVVGVSQPRKKRRTVPPRRGKRGATRRDDE